MSWLEFFDIGTWSLILPFVGVVGYFAIYQLRRFDKWRLNDDRPLEKATPTAIIIAVIMFIPGSYIQHLKNACIDEGYTVSQCIFPITKM